jgi:hypothetical protein
MVVRPWFKRLVIGVAAILVMIAVAVLAGTLSWSQATEQAIRRLDSVRQAGVASAPHYSTAQLAGLPAPVVRYFGFALPSGVPLIRRARIHWIGEFLMQAGGAWSPFTADQVYVVRPPGYVWDASIRMAPLVDVRVRDSYAQGVGRVHAKAASLYTVANDGETPEIATAALQRYLAECVFLPTALLPSAGVEWTPIDDSTARATLSDRGVTAIVQFHFAADGAAARISALRYRTTSGTMVPTPWVGTVGNYHRVQGMMVPTSGEAEWELPEGRSPYWRGQLTTAAYE